MNVVGYKVLISKEDTETLNKFYMNVVGYKALFLLTTSYNKCSFI